MLKQLHRELIVRYKLDGNNAGEIDRNNMSKIAAIEPIKSELSITRKVKRKPLNKSKASS